MPIQRTKSDDVRPPELVPVLTPGGVRRVLTILDPRDEARYRSVVERVTGVVERALGPEVLANRASPGLGLALRPWRPAWRRLLLERRALSARGPVLLHTDVRRCYPSIGGSAVHGALRRLGAGRDDARVVAQEVDRFQAGGVPGLPIGPDPSAVLANAVLVDADLALQQSGCHHVRWVDDVWASARTRGHAERALAMLRAALERIGLEVNEEKTTVFEAVDAASFLGEGSGARL